MAICGAKVSLKCPAMPGGAESSAGTAEPAPVVKWPLWTLHDYEGLSFVLSWVLLAAAAATATALMLCIRKRAARQWYA